MKKLSNKKWFNTFGKVLAAVALVVTTCNVNSACIWAIHQEEVPSAAKRLRKF